MKLSNWYINLYSSLYCITVLVLVVSYIILYTYTHTHHFCTAPETGPLGQLYILCKEMSWVSVLLTGYSGVLRHNDLI